MISANEGHATARSPEPRRLRVLLAPSAYYPHVGGIEELTRQLALALSARGHEVAVLTNRWPEEVVRTEVLDGITVHRLRFPLPAKRLLPAARFAATSPVAAVMLLRLVSRWRPDVIHIIGAGPQSAYFAALHGPLRPRLVFTGQGELTFDAHGVFERSRTLRAGLRRMLHNADAVTACSEYVMRDLASEGHIRGSSSVIPNGVDPREFQAESEASGDPAGDPYVLAVGRLVPQKGFDLLLDAFRSSRLTGLNLVFAGDGFERQRLEAQAAEIGLSARVRFLGSVTRPRLAALLRGAHAFAFPSRGEAFGIALLEAMAAGVPAVAAAAGGVPELAADGYNALVVHPEDATALAAALDRVASDAGLRERLIAGGLETASQLEWSKIAGRYEDVYREALGGGGA